MYGVRGERELHRLGQRAEKSRSKTPQSRLGLQKRLQTSDLVLAVLGLPVVHDDLGVVLDLLVGHNDLGGDLGYRGVNLTG